MNQDQEKTGRENKRRIGKRYEDLAADYLRTRGMEILEQNYCHRAGEIDLIGKDGDYLVFIEVKYRRNRKNGEPAEAVNEKKQQHIRRAAQYYLYRHRCGDIPCRFDVISILGNQITWIQDAF